ncbi:probable ATP-dependent RNA helicase DDX31 [Lineus longissimus]|uniref:probable ATP-dependent RNA helicase DDX31 n=1 Tax=Lineus longissimus TaxID=88925 RepID=UPI002B4F264B
MSDNDGDMQLNIVTGGSSDRRQKQTKIRHQHRSVRIKERKKAKWLKGKEESGEGNETADAEPEESAGDVVDEGSPPKAGKRKADGGDGVPAKKTKTGPVISSLFKNNPNIPHVVSSQVDKVQERVFSSQTFSHKEDLHPYIVKNLEERMGLLTMTAVQQQTIPVVLQGKDVLVKSQTGSGKTLSYAIPIVQMLQGERPKLCRNDGVFAIVIVPTRELAVQSFETFQKLVYSFTWLVAGSVMGGENRKSEKARLRKGINILVATPGRLLDHLQNTTSINIARLKWLVLDEADRLLDLGYEKDVSQIINILDEKKQMERQTLLLSATLSPGVEKLAGMSLKSPVHVDIVQGSAIKKHVPMSSGSAEDEGSFSLPDNLKQHFIVVPSKLRLVTLAAFILWKCKFSTKGSKVIVFLSTQDSVEFHHNLLTETICRNDDSDDEDIAGLTNQIDLFKLHGDMDQKARTKVYQEYVATKSGVLLCTDVAARGLDLPNVRWIIQYNTPGSPSDYIHRVGRTARAGSRGHALIFLTPSEVEYVKVLSKYHISMEEVSMDDVLKTLLIPFSTGGGAKPKENQTKEQSATSLQMTFESCVQGNKDMAQLARKAYLSFLRAYATYPTKLKHIFHLKSIHLGHVAKAFALREAPAQISHKGTIESKKHKKKDSGQRRNPRPAMGRKMDAMSEFASGFEGINPFKKTKKRKS